MTEARHKRFAIIMAGGRGERFWPLSRESTPKQLIRLLGDTSLLQETVRRIKSVIPVENILVITNESQLKAVRRQLAQLPSANVIAEPCGRDTCAAVALGAAIVAHRCADGVMAVLPADHLIAQSRAFQKVLRDTMKVAAHNDVMVTIGIPATEPSTAYGYIRFVEKKLQAGEYDKVATSMHRVERFVEKPNRSKAKRFVQSGHYYWNAGMFIWSVNTIVHAMEKHQPAMAKVMHEWIDCAGNPRKLKDHLLCAYPRIEKTSIDFALMEKASNVIMAQGAFGWDDLGSWTALTRHVPQDAHGNAWLGQGVQIDSHQNIIFDGRHPKLRTPLALVGVKEMIVVLTDDVCLLAEKSQDQKIKAMVQTLARSSSTRHLVE